MDELVHYGTKRHSGRYPYGSGENPYQHEANFLSKVKELKEAGLTDKEIADYFDMSIRELRSEKSISRMRVRDADRAKVLELMAQGKGPSEIAKILGRPESTIRALAKDELARSQEKTQATIDILKHEVDTKTYVDVGKGVAASMSITDTRLDTALQALKDQGYEVHNIYVEQAWNPGQYTTVRVLAKPGTTKQEVYQNRADISVINSRFEDQNSTELAKFRPVESISSSKIEVRYSEDGGANKDGVIEIRRGAEGLDLGESRYAQVRIAVDDTHYLKGMAVYSDDLPDGVDIRFNTNKSKDSVSSDLDAMKKIKGDLSDPAQAFETSIKPGGQKGYLNIVNEEGDWSNWSKTLSSQILSKQTPQLAKRQLDAAKLEIQKEYDDISKLTNPVLKEHLLNQYADKCDTAAVRLKAAAMPRQANHVILPLETIKSNEIYAPNYRNGESVVLIRHPHGGTFEIPELRVNNNNKEAKQIFENAPDAVGIHSSVAARLSGADFDGDTVLVIPNNDRSIKTSPAIKSLQEFEPKISYKMQTDSSGNYPYTVKHAAAQNEMGVVSNLITDMTLKKAPVEDITRAVKYSMVVIDAEKHNLDYKQAKKDLAIDSLKDKYQKHADGSSGGASTLISRSSAGVRVPEFKKAYRADPATGKVELIPTNRTYTKTVTNKKTGEKTKVEKPYLSKPTPQMRLTDDAKTLSSGTVMESIYADYANAMKSQANKARKEAANLTYNDYSPSMAKRYSNEIKSLDAKVKRAQAQAPLERKAQLLAESVVDLKVKDNPDISQEQMGKVRTQALTQARAKLGGTKPRFDISDKEWEAIQSGAVSKTKQKEIFKYTDQDALKERATPKSNSTKMTASMIALAKARIAMGYTISEVADSLGVSTSTINNAIRS